VAVASLAVIFVLALGADSARLADGAPPNSELADAPRLTHPFGATGDALLSPLARWDSVWYLGIAESGYEQGPPGTGPGPRAAFFPLYPLLVRAVGEAGGASPQALLVASYAVSLAAFLGALYLFHRLVALELGRRFAGPAILLLATFPAALFFGAPYSESVFLLVSVGAFYAARTGRWAWAGALAAAASATRSAGILLLVPLVLLYFYGPRGDRRRETDQSGMAPGDGRLATRSRLNRLRPRYLPRADMLWLLLAPLGLAAYAAYLALAHGDGLAFAHVQEAWYREFAGPFGGVWEGAVAAVDGVRQLASGPTETVLYGRLARDPMLVARQNLMLFGFLVFTVVACVGVLRRLPIAYGAYVVAALALPLSFPVAPEPLMSLPRFVAVLFPIFVWLALVCEERRRTALAVGVSSALLAVFVVRFATWHWVA
jgi:hypothetical protein